MAMQIVRTACTACGDCQSVCPTKSITPFKGVYKIDPDTCTGCNSSLAGSTPRTVERRQVVDLPPVPAPVITEYCLGARTCRCCGVETTAEWTDLTDIPDTPAHTDVLAGPGSPVRIGPRA